MGILNSTSTRIRSGNCGFLKETGFAFAVLSEYFFKFDKKAEYRVPTSLNDLNLFSYTEMHIILILPYIFRMFKECLW